MYVMVQTMLGIHGRDFVLLLATGEVGLLLVNLDEAAPLKVLFEAE